MKNVKIHSAQPDQRPTLVFDDVRRLELSGFDSPAPPSRKPLVLFRDVVGALLFGNRLSSPAAVFLGVTGAESKAIALRGNDLRLARKVAVASSGATVDAISMDPVR